MMKSRLSLLFPLLSLALAACTPPSATRQESVAPPPRHETTAKPQPPAPQAEPRPEPRPPASQPPKTHAAPASPPAVLALLQEAEADANGGKLDTAAATLERGIRIQPRNAQLWHKLAELRLKQSQPGLAEDLAKKSNLLAKGDAALIRKNWAIIAEARRQKGDAEGATEADAKAGR